MKKKFPLFSLFSSENRIKILVYLLKGPAQIKEVELNLDLFQSAFQTDAKKMENDEIIISWIENGRRYIS
jgi:predicted transcriptional regulator